MYSTVFYTNVRDPSSTKPLSCLGFAFVGAHLPRLAANNDELGSLVTAWHDVSSLKNSLRFEPSRFALILYFGKELFDHFGKLGWTVPFREYISADLESCFVRRGLIFSYYSDPRVIHRYFSHISVFDVYQLLSDDDYNMFEVVTSFRLPYIHTPRQRAYWIPVQEIPPIWPTSGAWYSYGKEQVFTPVVVPGFYFVSEHFADEFDAQKSFKLGENQTLRSFRDYLLFMRRYCLVLTRLGRYRELTLRASSGSSVRGYTLPSVMRISEFVFLFAILYICRFGGKFRVQAPGLSDGRSRNVSYSRPVSGSLFDTFRLPLLYFFQPTLGGRVTGNTRVDLYWEDFLDSIRFEQMLLSVLREYLNGVPYSRVIELIDEALSDLRIPIE